MKQQVTIYENGQINKQVKKSGMKAAMVYAAHELGKALEHLTLEDIAVHVETVFLTKQEWVASINDFDGDEVFGIAVRRAS